VILLVFFLPVAFYLLALGWINRRRRPVLVAGTWDLIGLLFAASGFLLFGGPAVLSSLHERWRSFWLLGEAGAGTLWEFWILLWVLYFVAVVGGVALLFWRQRRLTCVYNVEPTLVERALLEACARLGLEPARSGNLYLFGLGLDLPPGLRGPTSSGIQAPHHLPAAISAEALRPPGPEQGPSGSLLASDELVGPGAILEVDAFPLMHHVSLRWDPADSPLRAELERALAQRLAACPAPKHETGAWLTLLGLFLLCCNLLGAIFLVLRWLLRA
jgi:hypothetical protein